MPLSDYGFRVLGSTPFQSGSIDGDLYARVTFCGPKSRQYEFLAYVMGVAAIDRPHVDISVGSYNVLSPTTMKSVEPQYFQKNGLVRFDDDMSDPQNFYLYDPEARMYPMAWTFREQPESNTKKVSEASSFLQPYYDKYGNLIDLDKAEALELVIDADEDDCEVFVDIEYRPLEYGIGGTIAAQPVTDPVGVGSFVSEQVQWGVGLEPNSHRMWELESPSGFHGMPADAGAGVHYSGGTWGLAWVRVDKPDRANILSFLGTTNSEHFLGEFPRESLMFTGPKYIPRRLTPTFRTWDVVFQFDVKMAQSGPGDDPADVLNGMVGLFNRSLTNQVAPGSDEAEQVWAKASAKNASRPPALRKDFSTMFKAL